MNHTFFGLALVFMLSLLACKENEPTKPTNDEELITTLKLKVYNQNDSSLAGEFVFKDEDGAGGALPSRWDTIRLKTGQYFSEVQLLNESNPNQVIDVTEEVLKEADQHMLFYIHSWDKATLIRKDLDKNGLPLGLKASWQINQPFKHTLKVILKHMPDVKKDDVQFGDTDIEVDFVVEFE